MKLRAAKQALKGSLTRLHLCMLSLFVLASPAQAATPAQDSAPAETVKSLYAYLSNMVNDPRRESYQSRYEYIQPIIKATHHLPKIAQSTLGRHWKSLNQAQQKAFIDEFSRFTAANYASRYSRSPITRIEISSTEWTQQERAVIQLKAYDADNKETPFQYLLERIDNQWKIINIVVQGINDLAIKRSEYNRIILKEGFNSLLAKLSKQRALIARAES